MGFLDGIFYSRATPVITSAPEKSLANSSVSPSITGSCALYRLEPAVDYLGGDLGADAIPASNQEACCAACERARRCNAFTFVAASRECWLKQRRSRARTVKSPTTLVSGHRGRLKPLIFGSGGTTSGQFPRAATLEPAVHLTSSAGLRASAIGIRDRTLFSGGSWRSRRVGQIGFQVLGGGIASIGGLSLQQERQTMTLLTQAAPLWRGVPRNSDGAPFLWLTFEPLPEISSASEAEAATIHAAAKKSLYLHWSSRAAAPCGMMAVADPSFSPVGWLHVSTSDSETTKLPTANATRGGDGDGRGSSGGSINVDPPSPGATATNAPCHAALPGLSASADAARPAGGARGHLLSRLTTGNGDGFRIRYRPVTIVNAREGSTRFLFVASLPASAMLHAAIAAETRGFDHSLLLTTSEPCGSYRVNEAGSNSSVHGPTGAADGTTAAIVNSVNRKQEESCRRAIAPILSAGAVMPSAGAIEATVSRGCGSSWASRWWPSGARSSDSFGCDARGGSQPLFYAFAWRRVLFLALSAAHTMDKSGYQHTRARRTVRAARAAGISWVVAYSERPANASSAMQLQQVLSGIGADVYICAPGPGRTARYERLLGRNSPTRKGISIVSLASPTHDAYVRARANRSTLLLEHVHASTGRVLDTFGVAAASTGRPRPAMPTGRE